MVVITTEYRTPRPLLPATALLALASELVRLADTEPKTLPDLSIIRDVGGYLLVVSRQEYERKGPLSPVARREDRSETGTDTDSRSSGSSDAGNRGH